MDKTRASPIKNTAGEGFAIEDRVAAWLACHLLTGTLWPNPQVGLGDSWKHLLALSPFGTEHWRIELRNAVETVWPFFERWARSYIRSDHHARTFIHFIKSPAAQTKRLDGLCLLQKCVPMDDDYFWREQATRNAFAGFLNLLLEQNWPTIALSAMHRDAFMLFALKLTALQHPLGSEVMTTATNRLGGTSMKG